MKACPFPHPRRGGHTLHASLPGLSCPQACGRTRSPVAEPPLCMVCLFSEIQSLQEITVANELCPNDGSRSGACVVWLALEHMSTYFFDASFPGISRAHTCSSVSHARALQAAQGQGANCHVVTQDCLVEFRVSLATTQRNSAVLHDYLLLCMPRNTSPARFAKPSDSGRALYFHISA